LEDGFHGSRQGILGREMGMRRRQGWVTASGVLVLGALALASCGTNHPATKPANDGGHEDASATGRDASADATARDAGGGGGDDRDGDGSVSDTKGQPTDPATDASVGDVAQACVPVPVDADIPVDGGTGTTSTDAQGDARGGSASLPNGLCVKNAIEVHGECRCHNEVPTVCGAACTNVATDPDNCGACGRVCGPSSICAGSACGPSATPVVPGYQDCEGITLTAGPGVLYWTDRHHGTINRLSAACGAQTLASKEVNPSLLVVSGTSLFWTAPSTGTVTTIRKLSLLGGSPVDLVTETDLRGGIPGLAISDDGATLFYSAVTKVRGVPVAGGAPFDVAVEEGGDLPMALAISGSTIAYVTGINGAVDVVTFHPGVVASCGKLDPTDPMGQRLLNVNCTRAAGGSSEPFTGGLLLRDGNVIWSSFGYVRTNPIDVSASMLTQPIASTLMNGVVTALAAGPGADVFLAEDGLIERTATTTSTGIATAIERGQSNPSSIVVLGANLYWSTNACAINRTTF
jgi:hypothetical protein